MQRSEKLILMANDFNKRAGFVIALCTGVAVVLTLAWMVRVILLLLFAGLIGALLLSILTEWVQAKLKIRRSLALATVIATFIACVGLGLWMRGPAMAEQFSALQSDLPAAAHQVLTRIQAQNWGRWLLSRYADLDQLTGGLSFAITRIGGAVVTTASALVGLYVVVAVSLFVSAEPTQYLKGLHRLTPNAWHVRFDLCLSCAIRMLRSWLIAKGVSMLCIGALVSAGLWALGVPLAGTLGIIAGMLTFIPNLGPILSFLPAALLAFAISPTKGVLTALLFCLAHFLEGSIITPLVERQIVTLPPALTLSVQLILATLTGPLGVALAAPCTAVALGVLRVVLPPDFTQSGSLSHGIKGDQSLSNPEKGPLPLSPVHDDS